MSGRAEIFQFLAGEDVDGNQVDLGVTVLASLGGRHFDDFARAVLDDDEAVLPQGRALHGKGGRGTGVGALEGVLMLQMTRLVDESIAATTESSSSGARVCVCACACACVCAYWAQFGDGHRGGGVKAHAGRGKGKRFTYLRVVGHGG